MPRPSWQLDRRAFLRGTGVACALPWLEAMQPAREAIGTAGEPPRRTCFVYFPNGCSLPAEDDAANAAWRWFPSGEGTGFRFTRVLEALEPFRDELAVYGGLSHPKSRELLGHLAGDTWLTAGDLRGGRYENAISVDQVAARALARHTRTPCLVLSTDGGVGYKSRVSTLSFDGEGRPIPSEHRQRRIFERTFGAGGGATTEERRRTLAQGRKLVDLVRADGLSLSRRLGRRDREKLDEFLQSLSAVEEQVQRNEAWLDRPLGPVDAGDLELDANPRLDPTAYVRATFGLIVLALQTDLTRVVTYMLAREDGMGFGDSWPRLAIGVEKGHHTISHDVEAGHFAEWGALDRWYATQLGWFLGRLRETEDAHGPLLDTTMVLYGSACSTTHNARNYPLVLAGGRGLGLRQGHFTRFRRSALRTAGNDPLTAALVAAPQRERIEDDLPCANLLLSMLHALGVEAESFADSTGPLPGFLA